MRIVLLTLALGIVGACANTSDAEFTQSYCEDQGLEVGTAPHEQCVANKQAQMERNRAIQNSFRYSP